MYIIGIHPNDLIGQCVVNGRPETLPARATHSEDLAAEALGAASIEIIIYNKLLVIFKINNLIN